ncbi:hypothetical protein [uncultured Ralstonia sp.]|jgi:hypothetical protein|uniref:hypothetical protein n=1 Tax=Ralstonia sp. TaxID=54061 RepID=UPI001EAB0351|nr:hypothetical protein [uncultured Ralstonia sp.]UCF21995.1 MAG: hypothetical protein JSV72_13445 [Ralstonia sp.]
MVTLLLNTSAPDEHVVQTRFGGRPLVPADGQFVWPCCATCKQPMQFQGQIGVGATAEHPAGLLLMFMCQNDPGCCDEWAPDGGGNCALFVAGTRLVLAEPPAEGLTLRETTYGARTEVQDAEDYEAARRQWCERTGSPGRQVLGQLYGMPLWLQADETPACPACGAPMRLAVQLEEGPDAHTAMNFGSGCAYLFQCGQHPGQVKFLWQC